MSPLSIGLQAGSILLREGIEAILVIASLAAFLHRMGAKSRVKVLYVGAGAAIMASIAAAAVFAIFYNGAHDDRIEAVILAVTAALMLYMSGWLFLRQDPRAWNGEMRKIAEKALDAPGVTALAGIAFLAVFREGAETVLFLQALANTSGGWSFGFFMGLTAAAVALVALFIAMQWLALKLPLRPVFLATSALLFVMGLRFVGASMQELQEQTLLPFNAAPFSEWIAGLGFNPSYEALAVQGVIAVIAVIGVLASRRQYGAPAAHPAK